MRRCHPAAWARLALACAFLSVPCCLLAQTLPLGVPDSWKYLTFDPATKRVFIAHGSEITVVDSTTLRIIGHVPGLGGAHGVTIVPGGHGYAASSKTATVSVFDPKDFHVLAVLKAGEDANSVTYDHASNRVFVANDDSGTITVIDAATDRSVASIPLPGGEGIESSASDGTGHLFVNHSAQNNLIRIETQKAAIDAAWPLPGCTKPEGLALDAALHRLFISCENSRLLVLDADDGRLVTTVPIGPGSQTVLFDSQRQRIYTANADGTVSAIRVQGADHYVPESPIITARGARTAALDAATGLIYLVTADIDANAVATRPHHMYVFKPGTAKLLVIDPASKARR